MAACSAPNSAPAPSADQAAPDPSADYLSPPVPDAIAEVDGAQRLSGHARPGSRVRLTAIPSRQETYAQAGPDGVFRFNLARVGEARLYALAMETPAPGGPPRLVQAEGYLFVSPNGRAALLRAGAGAQSLSPPAGPLRIAALDHDHAGGAVVSGMAHPSEQLTARVDQVTRGRGVANPSTGRFSIALEPLASGAHQIVVAGPRNTSAFAASISNPPPLTQGPFRAERTAFGWRIDWMTPGGGLQTTLIID